MMEFSTLIICQESVPRIKFAHAEKKRVDVLPSRYEIVGRRCVSDGRPETFNKNQKIHLHGGSSLRSISVLMDSIS